MFLVVSAGVSNSLSSHNNGASSNLPFIVPGSRLYNFRTERRNRTDGVEQREGIEQMG